MGMEWFIMEAALRWCKVVFLTDGECGFFPSRARDGWWGFGEIPSGESNPDMYFSTGRKVPKAHRGGQSVHEGVAAPAPPYPNSLRAHCRGAALISPRGGDMRRVGGALKRHNIQHASSTGSLAWGLSPRRGNFAAAAATKGLCDRPLETFAAPPDGGVVMCS